MALAKFTAMFRGGKTWQRAVVGYGLALAAAATGCGRLGSDSSREPTPGAFGSTGGAGGAEVGSVAGEGGSTTPGTEVNGGMAPGEAGQRGSGDEGTAGAPFCGGCAPVTYSVRCAQRELVLGDEVAFGEGPLPEQLCAAARRAVLAGGEGGASSAGAGGGAGQSSEAPGGGGQVSVSSDLCETYVDPPRVYFDEGCIAYDDENGLGRCELEGDCCVVLELISCGI